MTKYIFAKPQSSHRNTCRGKATKSQRKRKRSKAYSSESDTEIENHDQVDQSRGDEPTDQSLSLQIPASKIPPSIKIWDDIGKPTFVGITPCFGYERPPAIEPEPIDPTLGFHSMGGCDHLLEQVRTRILFPLKNKEFMERHGREPPKGIILHGAPGTGKTLFAKCLAAELSRLENKTYKFFMRRGTDILSKWVGESEKTVRQVFSEAIENQPSILFFDEIDGLCPNRNNISTNSCPVFANVVCTVLGEMDRVKNGEVLILGATNRIDSCDPALLRPGRFDISIPFHPPSAEGRKQIIQVYTQDWGQSSPSPQLLHALAHSTNGFTGADLNKLCSEAFFNCVQRCQKKEEGDDDLTVRKISGNEKITEDDWMLALGSMSPSKSNVFGSYIQVLQVSKFIEPLVQTCCSKLLSRLRPIMPKGPKLCKGGQVGGPNCFLIWNSYMKSDDILDLLIVPHLLEEFSGIILYMLNEETMLQQHNSFTINSIIKIINQAKDCDKPSVLFIPRIDKLAQRLGGETPLLRKLLFETGNKSVLVLATASNDVSQLPQGLQSIFDGLDRSAPLQSPSKCDRETFFETIFHEYAVQDKTKQSKGQDRNFEKLYGEAVNLTDHEDIWSMITLHRELVLLCRNHSVTTDKKALISEIELILKEYKANRLSSSRFSR